MNIKDSLLFNNVWNKDKIDDYDKFSQKYISVFRYERKDIDYNLPIDIKNDTANIEIDKIYKIEHQYFAILWLPYIFVAKKFYDDRSYKLSYEHSIEYIGRNAYYCTLEANKDGEEVDSEDNIDELYYDNE